MSRTARWTGALLVVLLSTLAPPAVLAQSVDPLEGIAVAEIRVTGLEHTSVDAVLRNLSTREGEPFHRANLANDERQLDALRLFASVSIAPHLDNDGVVLDVVVKETLRLLPLITLRVTDENGLSVGPGARAINLLGRGEQLGVAVGFGGETSIGATIDTTTVTPGTWARHVGIGYSSRRNALYDFDERATSADMRLTRNWTRVLRVGAVAEILTVDTGPLGPSLSADGLDVIPTAGAFVGVDTLDSSTDPAAGTWAAFQVGRLFGNARSWTFIADGRRFQPMWGRHRLGLFALATVQTGEVGVDLPEYLQFGLGGSNTIRGWSVGARTGRNQFIGTLEYVYVLQPVTAFSIGGLNLYGGLQLVAFSDLGLAWTDTRDFDVGSAIDGYGFGLRALVPFVDVVRLDVAWGERGQGTSVYFGLSPKVERQRQRVR